MTEPSSWYCCRIRAGPLTKECRALRPRFSKNDLGMDHRSKVDIKRYERTAVNRHQVDRLEIRLALLGPMGTHYTLTFDNTTLPWDFPETRRRLRNFLGRVGRWRKGAALDYIYAIEGLHGDHRYHVHFCCDYAALSPAEMQMLWGHGSVYDEPVLQYHEYRSPETGKRVRVCDGGFRRLAEYLNKERTDGVVIPIGRHPWSCSRSLNSKVPPPERWIDTSGGILVPDNVIWARRGGTENDFGAYYYGSWIEEGKI